MLSFKKTNFLFLIFILLVGFSCSNKKYIKHNDNFYSMGTSVEITFFSKKVSDKKLLEGCYELSKVLENKVSSKLDNTIISKLNISKKAAITDAFSLNLLKDALFYAKETSGAFEPTIYNLSNLWGFVKEDYKIPSQKSILENLAKTSYANILINGNVVTLNNNAALDLGAIAKGKIVDEISTYLEKNGVKNYLVNAGGDLYISGKYNDERLWKVGIINPFSKNNILGYMELTGCSIVTSGDYERNFTGNDGILYHHIIDGKTGYPVKNGMHSITVIADNAEKADALATALFVMGSKEALKFLSDKKDIQAIFIEGAEADYKIITTDRISYSKEKELWKFELK